MSENRHGISNFDIIGLIAIVLVIVIVIVFSIISKNNQYNEMLVNIDNKQWEQAKEKLDTMGNWKDTKKYVSEINYNYYLTVADEQFNNQNLENALDLYKKAKEYNNNEKSLDDKIKVVQNKIDKINKEKERLAEIERKKAEQERIARERAEQARKQKEIKELEYDVKHAFRYVNLQTFCKDSDICGAYEFFIIPEAWYQLSYQEKQNVIESCIRYVQLKEDVSYRQAQVGTRVMNVYDGKMLGNAISIK